MTALIALANASGLFQPNQLEQVGEMLADYFGENSNATTTTSGSPTTTISTGRCGRLLRAGTDDQCDEEPAVDCRPTRPPRARTRCGTAALR